MKIKICGITNVEDALLCESLGADALGFIFYARSIRYVTPESVKRIIKELSAFTIKVGVFVNETPEEINQISKELRLNLVQLHGNESSLLVEEINLPVIKSFGINHKFDFEVLNNYQNCYYLLDTFSESDFGGTGKTFDWQMIPDSLRDKIILSGGISSSNIQKIFRDIKPNAIDLSSSLEEYPGKKSKKKLTEFFNVIKGIR